MKMYVAVVHHDEGSAYGMHFPNLPGCFSAADELDDVMREAGVALSLYARDETLPEPRSLSRIASDPDVAGDLRNGASLIMVPLVSSQRKARVNVMIDPEILASADRSAREMGVSRSDFFAQAAADRIGAVVKAPKAKTKHAR